MGSTKWGAVALMVALAACAQQAADDEVPAGDTATTAEPSPAPAAPAPEPASANLPAGVTTEMVTQGQQIFAASGNCFTCHGPDAKGTTLAPNLTDSEWVNVSGTYDDIVQVIKTGVATPKQHPAPMPAMGGASLSEDQVKQVAAYVWSLGGGK